jgi:hypothetical protein
MASTGNSIGNTIYGAEKIDPGASKEQKQRYVVDKYEKRALAAKASHTSSEAARKANTSQPKPRGERTDQVSTTQPEPSSERTEQVATMATAHEVPNSLTLFDELFNEKQDSYFGTTLPLKSTSHLHPDNLTCSSVDNDLDSFLNTMLNTNILPARSLDPTSQGTLCSMKAADVEDLFADWPDL